jgi:hypothetical protein
MLESNEKVARTLESVSAACLGSASLADILLPNTDTTTEHLPVLEIYHGEGAKVTEEKESGRHGSSAKIQELQSIATFGLPDAGIGLRQLITQMIGARDAVAGKMARDWFSRKQVDGYYTRIQSAPYLRLLAA